MVARLIELIQVRRPHPGTVSGRRCTTYQSEICLRFKVCREVRQRSPPPIAFPPSAPRLLSLGEGKDACSLAAALLRSAPLLQALGALSQKAWCPMH